MLCRVGGVWLFFLAHQGIVTIPLSENRSGNEIIVHNLLHVHVCMGLDRWPHVQIHSLVPRLHSPAFYRTVYKSGEGAWYISSRDMRHAVT